ncbi:MAG: prepilin-type N-terminal cleavage/methylation domain-containing protein [Phycisphaeraceae bacterium]|nr:prepilin-type N-terminal cleavage/methylation domain-containing protein [Phycisphaeraceae bacterium]
MRARSSRAFTLVEVLAAVVLSAMLLGSIMAFLWNLSNRRSQMRRMVEQMQAGGVVLGQIESDLFGSMAWDPAEGAGIKGSSSALRVLSRGVWPDQGRVHADLQVSEYAVESRSGAVTARRWSAEEGVTAPPVEVVTDQLERLRFRYYDGREWVSEFDSALAGRLPAAVEVGVWFARGTGFGGATTEAEPVTPPDRLRVMVVPDGASEEGS